MLDTTEGGAVDTEMLRFLRVLSELATFHINNNNGAQVEQKKERGKRREAGCNLAVGEGWGQLLRPDTNYTSFLCHFNIATRH